MAQVMRQPEYSRYPQLPASSVPWEICIPPEPQPEVSEEVEAPLAADDQSGEVQEEAASAAGIAAGIAAAVLPINLDLSGLLDGGVANETSGQGMSWLRTEDTLAKMAGRGLAGALGRPLGCKGAEGCIPLL